MRVIAFSTLRIYYEKQPEAEQPLRAWYDEVKKAEWKSFAELRAEFPKASIVGNGRVVFDIRGNRYRLIAKFEFHMNAVFVRFIGTHKEYDRVNAQET